MMTRPLDPPDDAEPDRATEYERAQRTALAGSHPFQPTAWPDTCGHPEPDGWFCGSSQAEHER